MVLVVDGTGDVKKGASTVGVIHQYPVTAGGIENRRGAVYLAYTAPAGHALIEGRLYLPRVRPDDPERLRAAGAGARGERFHDWALVDDRTDGAGVRRC
ncbi:SRSO17 transposase [Nocardiopsis terrae]|uniref:SRSO17 transposase n=1 Tax=Nocardiopsis terrae TaxID=372655 RepID=A0ABR9HKK6_9ACTN|nr:SRSO17 transposase [Nocardiopsis terrae]